MNRVYKLVMATSLTVLCLLSAGTSRAESVAGPAANPAPFAQNDTAEVQGKVFDRSGAPMDGVTVIVKGTNRGTVTLNGGTFSIRAASGEILVFNTLGYKTAEVTVGDARAIIEVVMDEDARAIDEVVVVGYGQQRKVNLTGAVGVVDTDALASRPVLNAVEAIQGTTPGLIIEQSNSAPGSRPSINIRGLNTMNNNDPLVIIDGIEGDIQNVGVNDIESISVLKDASSTAIYGARGSGGVIVITTRASN